MKHKIFYLRVHDDVENRIPTNRRFCRQQRDYDDCWWNKSEILKLKKKDEKENATQYECYTGKSVIGYAE